MGEVTNCVFHHNKNIAFIDAFIGEWNTKIVNITRFDFKQRKEGEAVVEKLNQVAAWARDNVEALMQDMKGMRISKFGDLSTLDVTQIVELWRMESTARLNVFVGRIDAEDRKLTPADKKKSKSALKSVRRRVA